MKALTVWQPWASLILIGAKPYEFRSWQPPRWLVGRTMAIHAGARPVRRDEVTDLLRRLTAAGFEDFEPCLHRQLAVPFLERVLAGIGDKRQRPVELFPDTTAVAPLTLPHSCVVATATVGTGKRGDLCAQEFGWQAGNDSQREGTFRWGWPLTNVTAVMPPHECTGKQGLWDWTAR